MAESSGEPRRPAPPYIAFQTLKTLTQNMKSDGLPGRIDKTMLRNFSGAVAGQLLTALKFLSLTDNDGHPTAMLGSLVESYGTDAWAENLGIVILAAYAPLFSLNLETATPGQFTEKFGAVFDGEGETLRKAITFFVNAVRDAKIPISNYIMKNKKPRAAGVKKRAAKSPKTEIQNNGANDGSNNAGNNKPPLHTQMKQPSEMLLGLFDTKMDKAEQDALWLLIKHFKTKGE